MISLTSLYNVNNFISDEYGDQIFSESDRGQNLNIHFLGFFCVGGFFWFGTGVHLI